MAKRILIADDSVTIQKAFAMTFLGQDVSVTAARSADEAFALAQKARPDLIVADGAMPGRTGYDLCAQVRADAALRNIPVYILASGQQPYDDARGSKAGADGHLTKPWDTAVFLQQVTAAASTAATPRRTTAPSMPTAPPIPARDEDEADYGEISIEASGGAPTPAPVITAPAAVPRLPTPALPSAPLTIPPGMRPSLIPGMRPGTVPPPAARPGTSPVRTMAPAVAPAPPRPVAPPTAGRTMIGLPAAGAPIPGAATRPPGTGTAPMAPIAPAMRAPFAPAPPPAVTPVVPFAPPAPPPRARTMTPTPPPAPVPRARIMTPAPPAAPVPASHPLAAPSPLAPSSLAQSIDQKLAAISSKGPEYEAIAKLSREVIEQVVWEIVPELAEAIIRDHLQKSGRI